MTKRSPIHITIPPDLNDEIEEHREKLKKEIGFKPQYSDMLRHLIRKGLEGVKK